MKHPTFLAVGPNTRRRVPHVYTLLLAAAFLMLGAPAAQAVTLDEAARSLEKGRRVYDFADVLSDSDERRLNDQIAAMAKGGTADGAIVMLDRLEGQTIEEFALGLGERWKAGRRDSDNGFILAVSLGDRNMRIEVGKDLQSAVPDAVAGRIIREDLRPNFRERRYADGLAAALTSIGASVQRGGGAEALPVRPIAPQDKPVVAWFILLSLGTITAAAFAFPRGSTQKTDASRLVAILLGIGALGAGLLAVSSSPQFTGLYLILAAPPVFFAGFRLLEGSWTPVRMEDLGPFRTKALTYYWIGTAVLFLAGLAILRRPETFVLLLTAVPLGLLLPGYFQRMPRKCLDCGGELRWLLEKDEPQRLHQEEALEQRLGSMEYDVWHCERCDRSAVIARARLFAGYAECPKCHRRTLRTRTEMTEPPTAFADGFADEITECVNPQCNHTDIKRKTLDRRGGGFGWDGGPGIIILPGGWGGGGGASHGDSGGGWGGGGGFDAPDFGGGGGFDGGGASGDW